MSEKLRFILENLEPPIIFSVHVSTYILPNPYTAQPPPPPPPPQPPHQPTYPPHHTYPLLISRGVRESTIYLIYYFDNHSISLTHSSVVFFFLESKQVFFS